LSRNICKDCIEDGEELFFNYGYDKNSRPPWLHKIIDDGSKEDDDLTFSQGKAKKHCSRLRKFGQSHLKCLVCGTPLGLSDVDLIRFRSIYSTWRSSSIPNDHPL